MFLLHNGICRAIEDGVTREATMAELRMLAKAIYHYGDSFHYIDVDTRRRAVNDIYRALSYCGYVDVKFNHFYFSPINGAINEIRSDVRPEDVNIHKEIEPMSLELMKELWPRTWKEILDKMAACRAALAAATETLPCADEKKPKSATREF